MSQALERSAEVYPYRLFGVEVLRLARLSPSFLRVTFAGADLGWFADCGFDQRIKLVLPLPRVGFAHLPSGPDWYPRWRELPEHLRNPVRTYTVRAFRRCAGELDVDFALHGDGGPAAQWANAARPGARLVILGPDARYHGDHGGADFRLPHRDRTLLLAGDETAVPAIASILERLPAGYRGHVLLEVPRSADALTIVAPPGMRVSWLGRDGARHGSRLIPAVREVAEATVASVAVDRDVGASGLDDPDVDTELLWDVPDHAASLAAASGVYAWLAGEAGVIKTLRRHLVTEVGVDRGSVAFMGYWRLGLA